MIGRIVDFILRRQRDRYDTDKRIDDAKATIGRVEQQNIRAALASREREVQRENWLSGAMKETAMSQMGRRPR